MIRTKNGIVETVLGGNPLNNEIEIIIKFPDGRKSEPIKTLISTLRADGGMEAIITAINEAQKEKKRRSCRL